MSTIFSKIVEGSIPCYKVAENNSFLAFLDINPLAEGHTLVIPKKETDYIFDIEDKTYQDYFLFAKKVALAMKKVIPCKKIGIAVVGLEVAHAHIHLVPLNHVHDLNFANPKVKLAPGELQQIAYKINQAYSLLP